MLSKVYQIDTTVLFSLALLSVLVVFALPAQAQNRVDSLTETNVADFIITTTHITTDNDGLDSSKIKDYLNRHIEDRARFKSTLKYHIPGMPVQKTVISLSKAEFMTSVNEGAEKIDGYETIVEIDEIKIDSGGKKAFVKTTNTEYAVMPVPTETGDIENVPMEGISNCNQILSLNGGIIQMFSASCTTNVMFLDN